MQEAIAAYQQGDRLRARRACEEVIARDSSVYPALALLGALAGEEGDPARACNLLTRAAALNPTSAPAWFAVGKAYRDAAKPGAALEAYDRAIALDPGFADAHNNRGNLLVELNRLDEAAAALAQAVAIRPAFVQALGNLGRVLQMLGLHPEAQARCREALALDPRQAGVWVTLGNALRGSGESAAARQAYESALASDPSLPEAHHNLGVLHLQGKDYLAAETALRAAISRRPTFPEAHYELGGVLHELGRQVEALESYRQALQYRPGYRDAALAIGRLLRFLDREDEAVTVFDKMLDVDPGDVAALSSKAAALMSRARHPEALQAYGEVVKRAPDTPYARGLLLHAKMLCCDWAELDALYEDVRQSLEAGREAADPFGFQAIGRTPEALLLCARRYAQTYFPDASPVARSPRVPGRHITVGYLSGEFRYQATSILLTEILECHDAQRFRVLCFDNGHDDGSALRQRIVSAVGEVLDIRSLSDDQVANLVSARGVDILVNLNGYFGRARQGVFARHAAPIQVNYLGFPGTLGAPYMDYIVADPLVIPQRDFPFYDEKVVWLPDSYQPNDRKRAISDRTFTRAEVGLPDAGVVFCCFNNTYKILPEVFDVWMRLLRSVPDSSLWLYEANAVAADNLRRESALRGVDPSRIVFGGRMDLPDHLARLRLADLFLDTLPYNAHTTASDALWAGLPVLTCVGNTFPARVGASLLQAVGLPELITTTLADYEALALRLARHPGELAAIREKLSRNRLTTPLFDSERYTRHLEDAYEEMIKRHDKGLKPDHLAIAPRPAC